MKKETKQIKIDKSTYDKLEKIKESSKLGTFNDAILKALGEEVEAPSTAPKKRRTATPEEHVPRIVIEVLILDWMIHNPYSTRFIIVEAIHNKLEEMGWDKEKPEYFQDTSSRGLLKTGIDNCLYRLANLNIIEPATIIPNDSFDSIWSKSSIPKIGKVGIQYQVPERYQRDSVNKNLEILMALITPKNISKQDNQYTFRLGEQDLLDADEITDEYGDRLG